MNFIHTLANSILTPEMGVKLRRNKIIKDNSQYKGLIQTNEKYRNIHDGERCFIIGNGPSLKNVNLSRMASRQRVEDQNGAWRVIISLSYASASSHSLG